MKILGLCAVLFLALTLNSCQKEAEDTPEIPTVSNADLTGDFEGKLGSQQGLGIVLYSFELKENSIYTCSYEGNPVADVEVTGNQFFATPLPGAGFKSFEGYISEDLNTVVFNGIGLADESFGFTGNRILNGVRTKTDMLIDGKAYARDINNNFDDCDNQLSFEFLMFPSFLRIGAVEPTVNINLTFDEIPNPGTYNVTTGQVSGSTVGARLDYLGEPIRATTGSVTVTGDGTLSGVIVQTDNLNFNEGYFSKDPVAPISTEGMIQCNN